uniref:Uncharacterized protein n=1 Tax=Rhizophora mucronata TaxID=61149 RepID=A0A2P2P8S1_RHIMU
MLVFGFCPHCTARMVLFSFSLVRIEGYCSLPSVNMPVFSNGSQK